MADLFVPYGTERVGLFVFAAACFAGSPARERSGDYGRTDRTTDAYAIGTRAECVVVCGDSGDHERTRRAGPGGLAIRTPGDDLDPD